MRVAVRVAVLHVDIPHIKYKLKVMYHLLMRVLQCVAVCCSVLQSVAVCCSALQCVAVRVAVRVARCHVDTPHSKYKLEVMYHFLMQCITVRCSALQCVF